MKSRITFGILYAVCEVTLMIMILAIAWLALAAVLSAFDRDFVTAIVIAAVVAILSFGLKETAIRSTARKLREVWKSSNIRPPRCTKPNYRIVIVDSSAFPGM